MSIVISANFNNMQFCTRISQLTLIFLQILFSKYFRYINSEFVYIFSFSVCLFIRKHQGLQFCKNVCKLEIIGTCKFDFRTIFGFGMMKSVYLCMAQLKIVIFSNFFHFRSHPNIHSYLQQEERLKAGFYSLIRCKSLKKHQPPFPTHSCLFLNSNMQTPSSYPQ